MHPPLLPSGTRARRARNSAIRNSNRSRPEIPPGDCMASTSRFLQSTLPDTSDIIQNPTACKCKRIGKRIGCKRIGIIELWQLRVNDQLGVERVRLSERDSLRVLELLE